MARTAVAISFDFAAHSDHHRDVFVLWSPTGAAVSFEARAIPAVLCAQLWRALYSDAAVLVGSQRFVALVMSYETMRLCAAAAQQARALC